MRRTFPPFRLAGHNRVEPGGSEAFRSDHQDTPGWLYRHGHRLPPTGAAADGVRQSLAAPDDGRDFLGSHRSVLTLAKSTISAASDSTASAEIPLARS